MAIEFACPSCRQQVRVADAAAGKRGKCPRCGGIVQVPAAALAAAPSQPHAAPPAGPASVSFPCPGCGRTMSAPASLAGKKGKCPHCQTIFVVGGDALQPLGQGDLMPLGGAPGGGAWKDSPAGLSPLSGGDDLFASLPPLQPAAKPLPTAPNPLGYTPSPAQYAHPTSAPNPYASPTPAYATGYAARPSVAPARLMIPAVAMIVIAAISIVFQAIHALNFVLGAQPLPPAVQMAANPEAAEMGYKAGVITFAVIGALINVGVIAGAVQMIRLRGWDTARGGAVAAAVPCCSVLCLNMPFGIWALIVLLQPETRRLFSD